MIKKIAYTLFFIWPTALLANEPKDWQLGFLKSASKNSSVTTHPIGALTKKSELLELAELFEMKNAGAIGFGDYKQSIGNPNLLKLAL